MLQPKPKAPLFARIVGLSSLLLAFHALPPRLAAQSGEHLTINQIKQLGDRSAQVCKIEAYITITDDTGSPRQGVDSGSLEVTDSTRGEVVAKPEFEIDDATEPGNVVLAMDISGSMTPSDKISAAREAARTFLARLAEGGSDERADQVAIYSFEGQMSLVSDWQPAGGTAARDAIAALQAVPDAPTCMFDMALEAIDKVASQPGRGTVVLFTDGIDERPVNNVADSAWPPCSSGSLEEVVERSRETGVALFTVGLRARANREEQQRRDLLRLAGQSGGRSWIATAPDQLASAFDAIATQLRNQIRVRYQISAAATADRTVTIKSTLGSKMFEDRRTYAPCDPGPKSEIRIAGDGGASSVARVSVRSLNGVQSVKFMLDGELAEERLAPPFETRLGFGVTDVDDHELCVIVKDQLDVEGRDCLGKDGVEAASPVEEKEDSETKVVTPELPIEALESNLQLNVPAEIAGVTTLTAIVDAAKVDRLVWRLDGTLFQQGTPDEMASIEFDASKVSMGRHNFEVRALDSEGHEIGRERKSTVVVESLTQTDSSKDSTGGGASSLLLLLGAGVVGLLLWRRRRSGKTQSDEGDLFGAAAVTPSSESGTGASRSAPSGGADIMSTRDVRGHDAAAVPVARLRVKRSVELAVGTVFELPPRDLRIGRGSKCDIAIEDPPVSRMHALLSFDGSNFQVRDLGSTYGTKVNGVAVSGAGTPLHHGDELQLGTRTVLVLEHFGSSSRSEGGEDAKKTQMISEGTGSDDVKRTQVLRKGGDASGTVKRTQVIRRDD